MNLLDHHIRTQIIQKTLSQAQQQKQANIKLSLNDPFQIYHYPTYLQNYQQIQNLKNKIKQKITTHYNIIKMKQIQQEIKQQFYITNQLCTIQQMELEQLDAIINQLEGQVSMEKTRKNVRKIYKQKGVYAGCQTDQIKYKSIGTNYQDETQTNKSIKAKQKYLFSSKAYSLAIPAQQQHPKIKSSFKLVKSTQTQIDLPRKISNKSNEIKQIHPQIIPNKKNENMSNIQQLYTDLQKQMGFMEHLKGRKKTKQYQWQKNKIKFLIELFWKNVQINNQNYSL